MADVRFARRQLMNDIEKKKEEIREELDRLKHEFNVELPGKIAEARAHGDLKENADYHAARERQGFVNARIAQLTAELGKISSIDTNEIPKDRVGMGSKVTLADTDSSMVMDFSLVTDAESNPSQGKLSFSTPYGKALAGKQAGDIVEVTLPVGLKKFLIRKLVTVHGLEFNAK